MSSLITQVLIVLPPILFALTFHEFAHAWTANKLGDSTAKDAGRLTLNPLAHLDPVGTAMIIITTMAGAGFGWARPVPVDFRNLRNPRHDMMWIALAGPMSNIILAFICGWLLFNVPSGSGMMVIFKTMLRVGVMINLILAVFNLLPLPPLDGSRIVTGLLPQKQAYQYSQLEQYGAGLLIMVIVLDQMMDLHLLRSWIFPPVTFFQKLIFSLFS